MKARKYYLLSIVTVIVLSLQLVSPVTARADGEITPPPEEATEVTATADPAEATAVPEIASTPVPTELTADPVETSTTVPPTESTELPTNTPELAVDLLEASTPLPPKDPIEPVTSDETVEKPTVAEILQQIPEGTVLVIFDENGELEPLATQDAAEIITTGDPMWCPEGILPGGAGCTSSYTTIYDLMDELYGGYSGSYSGSGTIYFTSNYSVDDADISVPDNLTDLVIQGGWNGLTGSSFALSGNSVFTVPISIWNSNGYVTVNNITVSGANETGLSIHTSQGASINDSTFSGNGYQGTGIPAHGADISANTVTISNSTFSGNDYAGAYISGDAVTISNSTFSGNETEGADIWAYNNLTISNSNFNGNSAAGAYIEGEDITISDSSFSENNGGDGLYIEGNDNDTNNTVVISNSIFRGNSYHGAQIWNSNSVAISNSIFSGNASIGAYMYGEDITISNSTFSGNGDDGALIAANNNVTISNSSFSGNDYAGAFIYGEDVTISNSSFSGNAVSGADLNSVNSANIVGSTFSENNIGLYVLEVYETSLEVYETSNVAVSNSLFSGNAVGIYAVVLEDMYGESSDSIKLDLECVQFTNNAQDLSQSGDVTVTNNSCFQPSQDRDHDGIIDSEDACPDIPGIKTDNPLTNGCPLQPQIIPVEGNSITFSIDCSLFSSYIPAWPSGDRVVISCVPNGTVHIDRVENIDLPGTLEAGYQYASGFNVQVFQDDAPLSVMPENGSIQVSFVAEEGDVHYGIMYWDTGAGAWVLLEEFQQNLNGTSMQFSFNPQDLRTILKGTQFTSGNPGREEVTTNFTGTYVLVVQK